MQRKWKVLSGEIGLTGGYNTTRTTPRQLSSRYYARRAVIRETTDDVGDRTILAYAALWPTQDPNTYELGTVWVHTSLRGNGMSREVMTEVATLASPGVTLRLITKQESIMQIARDLGFIQTEQVWDSERGLRWLFVREPQ